MYQRNNRLVQIVPDDMGGYTMHYMTQAQIASKISERAIVYEFKKTSAATLAKTGQASFPFRHRTASRDVVASVAEAGTYPGIPVLDSVTDAPQFLPDGTVQDKAGYDPRTRTYLAISTTLPPVGETRQDAVRAVRALMELLKDFPLSAPARGRGIWLAALLTRLARGAFDGPCPMFVSRANIQGAGKTKFWNLIGLIADGHEPEKTAFKVQERDFNDEIIASLAKGPAMLMIDNVPPKVTFDSATLACVLTTGKFSARMKSAPTTAQMAVRAVMFATGNGMRLPSSAARERRSAKVRPSSSSIAM